MADCVHGVRRDVMHCVICELEEERDEAREMAVEAYSLALCFAFDGCHEGEREDWDALQEKMDLLRSEWEPTGRVSDKSPGSGSG